MGATDFRHIFEHYDWRIGVASIQQDINDRYGYQEGYSGEINVVNNFSMHNPGIKFKDLQQVWDYVRKRVYDMDKNTGEVIDLGVVGYSIAKPSIQPTNGAFLPIDVHVLRSMKEPAMLITSRGFVRDKGSVADLKKRAAQRVLQERFEHDYYIVGKNIDKVLRVTGEGNMVKRTTRKSNSTTLVLEYHKYVVYGLASS